MFFFLGKNIVENHLMIRHMKHSAMAICGHGYLVHYIALLHIIVSTLPVKFTHTHTHTHTHIYTCIYLYIRMHVCLCVSINISKLLQIYDFGL